MHYPRLAFVAIVCTVFGTDAEARIYKCVDADGKSYFSDISCPAGTKKKEIQVDQQISSDANQRYSGGNPYSVMDQTKHFDEERAEKQQIREAQVRAEQEQQRAMIERQAAEIERQAAVDEQRKTRNAINAAQAAAMDAKNEAQRAQIDAQQATNEARQAAQDAQNAARGIR